MTRSGLVSDELWARIEPLLPSSAGRRGGRWRDHRQVIEAIAWRYRTGTPWRDLPEEFGPSQTVWKRHDRWSRDGTYERLVAALQGAADAAGELDWLASADSSVVRAHQHAAGARRDADVLPGLETTPVTAADTSAETPQEEVAMLTGGSIELQKF